MLTEREERIVAWAKREADRYAAMADNRVIRCGADVRMNDHCKRRAEWFSELALMLERGEHLKHPEPTILASEWMQTPSVGH